jgi:hypothetical protein
MKDRKIRLYSKTMLTRFLIAYLVFSGFDTHAQPTALLLQNPSFEDKPGMGRTPQGWFYCGARGETPPDIHPSLDLFGVTHPPQEGETYIGMVVRDNGTWEGVSQWLQQPLLAEQCYELTVHAARSPVYESITRTTMQLTNFDRPVLLRLWGGNLNCERAELLAVSKPVERSNWLPYTLRFQPKTSYNRLIVEAYYTSDATPYCGNVLLDNLSPLMPVDCAMGQLLVQLDTLPPDVPTDDLLAEVAQQVVFSDLDQTVEQHAFYLPSGELQQANQPLFRLSQLLKNMPDRTLIVQIQENNKSFFKAKKESVQRELRLYGLHPRQFRIQQYRLPKGGFTSPETVFITIE